MPQKYENNKWKFGFFRIDKRNTGADMRWNEEMIRSNERKKDAALDCLESDIPEGEGIYIRMIRRNY